MTKTLTEQWREGTLESGMYYWQLPNDETFMATLYKMDEYKQTKDASKIICLAPVPSYDEYKRLQEQIKEANECIKDKYLFTCSACSLLGSCMSCGNRYFGRYIKKWGVK